MVHVESFSFSFFHTLTHTHTLQIKNNCKESVWPGIIPAGAAVVDSWLWKAGECKTLIVASSLPSLRVWGRTGCDAQFNCITGSCRVEGNGGCASAGEAPCSLWEATLQDHCTATPVAGMVGCDFGGGNVVGREQEYNGLTHFFPQIQKQGPDFFDTSLVDGYNLPIRAQVSGGFNVGQVAGAFSCESPIANAFDFEACPYELRVYKGACACHAGFPPAH